MSYPTVSVILPVYNGADHVSQALDSLIGQTFSNIEMIVIDDASHDDTWDCLVAYAARDNRIRLFRNEENLGLSQTLNEGIGYARGRYIARQDHDDVSLPSRLEEQVNHLELHKDVGLLGTAYYRIYPDGSRVVRYPPIQHAELRWRLLFGNVWCHASMILRRELLLQQPGFNRDYPTAQDYELWSRLITVTRGATLSSPLVEYRMLDTGLSGSSDGKQEIEAREISRLALERELSSHGLQSSAATAIRRLYMLPIDLSDEDLRHGADLLNLWNRFALSEDVDSAMVMALRRRWLRRLFACVGPAKIDPLLKSGLLRSLLRRDPFGVAQGLCYQWPRTAVRRTLSMAKSATPP